MRSCPGQLVVHRDGTVAHCTETIAGRRCAGEDRPHRGGFLACRLVDGDNCSYCATPPVTIPPVTLAQR
jgi:hypothetical protein